MMAKRLGEVVGGQVEAERGHRYVAIGHRFDAIAPIRSIARARCPVLLVHGDADDTVPLAEARAILAARGDTAAELLVVPGSHDSYGEVEEQMPRLLQFLAARLGA